jgi:hypothetical protein
MTQGGVMTRIDDIRGEVLARIDRTERNYRLAFFGAVALDRPISDWPGTALLADPVPILRAFSAYLATSVTS